MALSIADIRQGAWVLHIHDEHGRVRPIKRMGVISKVIYANGTTEYCADSVREVWVEFEEGKPAEKVPSAELVLHKSFDQASYDRIANNERNEVVKNTAKGVKDGLALTVGQTKKGMDQSLQRGI